MRRHATLALVVLCAVSFRAAADDAGSVTLPLKLPPAVEAKEPVPAPQDVIAAPAMVAAEPAPGQLPPVPQPKPSPPAKVVEMNPVDDMPGGRPIPTPPGGAPSVRCFVRDVMAFYDRTHVRCYNKVRGKIVFFAVDTSQPVTATVLEKALKGMQTGKPVTITYAPGTDLNPSNCDRKNCRRLLDIQN
jgi:hypothetical protein